MYGGGAAGRRMTPFGARFTGNRGTKRLSQQGIMDAPAIKKAVQRNGIGVKKEKQKVTAVERKQHLIVGISTEGSTISSDGSEFSINLNKFPLHVPPNAFNVGVRLVDLVIPYVWPNFNNTSSEQLTIEFEDEIAYTLTEVGENESGYAVPGVSETSIASGGVTMEYAFQGASSAISDYGTFNTDLTEGLNNKQAEVLTASLAATNATDITGRANFVSHFVWEERKSSGSLQEKNLEIVLDAGFFEVYRVINSNSGDQELYIRFSLTDSSYSTAYRLNGKYKWNETNVLTVLGQDYSSSNDTITVSVLYNDSLIVHEVDIDTSGTVTVDGHTWLATTGMAMDDLLLGFVGIAVGSGLYNMGSTDTLGLGYPTDGDEADSTARSYWFQHGILMSEYKGAWELRPHVKVQVTGVDNDSESGIGKVLNIPILHDDDTSLEFVTIPTLLGYMQRVINQYIFREFYLSQFLSVDLIENHTGSNGTNYLIQFDYDLRRSLTVTPQASLFRMNSNYYANNRMRVEMSPAPYFFYNTVDSDPDMLTIVMRHASTNVTYTFDITDLNAITQGQYGDAADNRDYLCVSRSDLAKFVYESIRQVYKDQNLLEPAPWDSRASQPTNSPIEAFYDNTATSILDLDQGTTNADSDALTGSYTIKFKDPADWKDEDGSNTTGGSNSFLTITMNNLTTEVSSSQNTTNVLFNSSTNSFSASATTIDTGSSNSLYFHIFDTVDSLTIDILLEDGAYSEEYVNTYLMKELNDYFMTSTHGSDNNEALIQIRGDEYTQQMQIGVLLSDVDPSLPNRAVISFPDQTATAQNGFAQMLFSGTTEDLDTEVLDSFVITASGGDSTGMQYTSFLADTISGLVPKPSYDDENINIAILDYSRVVSNFKGIRHEIVANDPSQRIFDFNPFSGSSSTTDKNLETNSYTIEIPSGSYTPESLTVMIDYLLHQQNPNIINNVVQIRDLKSIQKAQFGALVSSDPNNAYPHKVTIKSTGNVPTKLAALLGWDLTADGDVVIEAPDFRETNRNVTPQFAAYFSNQTNFETRSIFLLSNFSRNATSPDGSPLQIVAAFAPRAQRGENIIISPNQPIINDAGTYLKDDKLDEISFKLIDGITKEPLAIGSEINDGYTVVIALEYDEAKDQEEIMRPADRVPMATGI